MEERRIHFWSITRNRMMIDASNAAPDRHYDAAADE